jgi:hypothetical protein
MDASTLSFGTAVTGIAMTTGASPEAVALGCASIVGGLGGPDAGLYGARGSLIARPGCSALILGLNSAKWLAAEELLLDPVEASARVLRRLSQSVDKRRLDKAQSDVTAQPQNTHQLTEMREKLEGVVCNPENEFIKNRRIQLLRQPSFTLNSPSPETFGIGADEITDGAALIYYPGGRLLSRLIDGKVDRAWVEYAGRLTDALVGADHVYGKTGQIGTARVRRLSATLFASISGKQLRAAFGSGHAPVQQLLEQCWLLDPFWGACYYTETQLHAVEMGGGCYWEVIQEVFAKRQEARGLSLKLTSKNHQELLTGIHELQARLDTSIPAEYVPYIRHWRKLPAKILWTLFVLNGDYDDGEGTVPTALHLAEWTVRNHVAVLRGVVEFERNRREQQAKEAMLTKLADGPQTFRELMRRTSGSQRREIHQPVLQALINEGAVLVDEKDYYSLAHPLTKQAAP